VVQHIGIGNVEQVRSVGTETFLLGLADSIGEDFPRQEQFEKAPRRSATALKPSIA
jgi:ornithine cyclodeaminase